MLNMFFAVEIYEFLIGSKKTLVKFAEPPFFGPLEIDYTVVLLVTTTNVTGCDATIMVTTTRFALRFYQRCVRAPFVQVRIRDLYNVAAAGRCWLGFDDRHITTPLPYSTSIKSMS